MCAEIYGIDDSKEITPLMVRDAMVNCFYEAHCQDAGLTEDEHVNRAYCKTIVQKAFHEVQGNFDTPSADDIYAVMDKLAEFSKGFRSQEIIQAHYNQIQKLVEKMKSI